MACCVGWKKHNLDLRKDPVAFMTTKVVDYQEDPSVEIKELLIPLTEPSLPDLLCHPA